jgi:hypothetical protein
VTTIGKLLVCAGVPASVPLAARLKPAGSVLDVVKVTVPMPPLWVNTWLNGAPTVPVVVAGFVTMMFWQLMTRVYVGPVPVQPLESVAVTVIEKVPGCAGVPASVPFAASESPVGSVPLASENVVVPMPPLCVNVWLNGVPTVPVVTLGLVTVIVWQPIINVKLSDPVQPLESVATTVIGKVPLCVGVPESVPSAASVMPVGSVLEVVNVTVPMPPLSVYCWLYGVPTVPLMVAG